MKNVLINLPSNVKKSISRNGLVKNASILITGQTIAQVIAFPVGILLARTVGALNYGHYFTALALTSLFSGLILLGLDSIIVRETAKHPNTTAQILTSAFVPIALWSLLVVGLVKLTGLLLGYSIEVREILWFVAFESATVGLLNLGRASFIGMEQMQWDAASRILESVLVLVFALTAFYFKASILIIAMCIFAARLATLFVTGPIVKHKASGRFQFHSRLAKELIQASIPVGAAGLISALFLRLDTVILAYYYPANDVGLYAVASNLSMVWLPIGISLSTSLLPRMSSLYQDQRDSFILFFGKGLRFVLIVALPIGITMLILPTQLIYILYGPEYSAAGPALSILGAGVIFTFCISYFWNTLVALQKQELIIWYASGSFLIAMVSLLILVPRFGLLGAACSVFIRNLSGMLLLVHFVKKHFSTTISIKKELFSPFLAAIVLAGTFFLFRSILSVLVLIPIGGLLYLGVILFTGGFQISDVDFKPNIIRA